jgi:phosphatidylinositol-3-phosphatase
VTSDACPQQFPKTENLGHQLRTAGFSFAGYAESLPKVGFTGCASGLYERKHNPWVDFTGCASGLYERKHNPWVDFTNLPASVNRPFSSFPRDYRKLPTVSFVSPNMCHSMHDCSVGTGDRWMKKHLDRHARWATHHHSWLVITFDENAGGTANPIPTIIVGDHVHPSSYAQKINRYTLLRTIEHAFGLPALRHAAEVAPLSKI